MADRGGQLDVFFDRHFHRYQVAATALLAIGIHHLSAVQELWILDLFTDGWMFLLFLSRRDPWLEFVSA